MKDLRILLLEVTARCNAFCDQCGSRCDASGEDALSAEDILNLLSDVREHMGTDMMLNVTGGEPLMRKDLFSIMKEASRMGFDWGMVSNGVLISDTVIEKMKDSGMKTITISLDGVGKTHEDLRHLPGSFDRIVENIIKLKQANFLDHLQITFTANTKNVRELPALYELACKLGVDSFRTSCMDPIGRGEENRQLLLSAEELRWMFRFINETNRGGSVPIVWGCCHFLGNELDSRKFVCPTGQTIASVLHNGDIFVCPNVPRRPELIQGNIHRDRFSEVWERGFSFFRTERKPSFCEGCKYFSQCGGDSLHTWDFDKDRPKFCYKELFDKETASYEAYLKKKYAGAEMILVAAPEPADDIFVEPEAYREICAYFHMGKNHPASRFEQQMGLVGFKVNGNFVIKYAFPSYINRIGRRSARFSKETLAQSQRETEILIENVSKSEDREDYFGEGLRFLGFAHSHPGQQELCYSEGDEAIHRRMIRRFGEYIGILLDPAREAIGAYYGPKIRQGNLKIIL
ncbi:MAG: radical SAM protein [Lachnospiraceae bacterium]|nr:radical SAM protein [Lachnospiraceae bacterium]